MHHVGFLKKLKFKLGSHALQYFARSEVQTQVSVMPERGASCGFINRDFKKEWPNKSKRK